MTVTPRLGSRPRASTRGQRGAALLTAMIIVALVATLAASMVWQQWRAVQVEAAERARAQSTWILRGALDFALLILKEDGKGKPNATALTEPWATPLEESRLSTFLAVDKANADDGPEAFLSGNITDAQARFNLTNLVALDGKVFKPDPKALLVLQRLCNAIGVDGSVAGRIADGLVAAKNALNGPVTAAALEPKTVAQLTWLGIDAATVQALQPFVVILSLGTPVNVNTAPKEVIAAVANIDPASAQRLVQSRQRTPFTSSAVFKEQVASPDIPSEGYDVRSSYFEVRGRLRFDDHVLTERSIVYRNGARLDVQQRERIASLEQVGG